MHRHLETRSKLLNELGYLEQLHFVWNSHNNSQVPTEIIISDYTRPILDNTLNNMPFPAIESYVQQRNSLIFRDNILLTSVFDNLRLMWTVLVLIICPFNQSWPYSNPIPPIYFIHIRNFNHKLYEQNSLKRNWNLIICYVCWSSYYKHHFMIINLCYLNM